MIEIKDISGKTLMTVPVSSGTIIHEELMKSDYIQLEWNSPVGDILPAGTFIEHDGEKYSLLEPYQPSCTSEAEYKYTPLFQSRIMSWDKHPVPLYKYDDKGNVISREFDWEFTGSPADVLYMVKQAIMHETGEVWTFQISESLPATVSLQSQSGSIFSILSELAEMCETEWWVDKKSNLLHLSKCEHGEQVMLTAGQNVKMPSITNSKDGYYTRFYVFGSTKNITQNYQSGQATNHIVNKRLTLDPVKYPGGYKDIKGHFDNGVFVSDLLPGEIFPKSLYFDDVFPSSNLTISNVRPRAKYRLDSNGNKIQIGGTEDEPVYEQYAIWYFRVEGLDFDPQTIIEGTKLSVSFESGQLAGRDFELTYHEKDQTVKDAADVTGFEVKAGDFEIIIDESAGIIIPGAVYIIPQDGDKIVLYNIEMADEYTTSAQIELEAEIDKEIARRTADNNSYEIESNPVDFYNQGTDVTLGQSVRFTFGSNTLETRVLMVEKRLDGIYQQRIRIGNEQIKGVTQELKEDVSNANQNIDVIKAFNELSSSLSNAYANAQREMIEGFAAIKDMWKFDPEHPDTIYSIYNVYSLGEMSAGGYSEKGGGGTGGIFGIKVNGETYTPEDGYITLPDYSTGASILGVKVNGSTYEPVDGYITIPDYPTELAWGAIAGKPTTIAGYGIQASDLLSTLKTVDGSGSGLDADTLDGYHYSDIINGNVASATKLKTSRTIWGQSFDGTNNVDGDIYINGDFRLNGNYAFFKNDGAENGIYFATKTNGSLGIYKHTSYSYNGAIGCFDYQTGYWGINTESPSYNLHVNGTMYAGGATTFGGTMSVSGLITASGGVVTQQYIQIGNGRIYWDENNKALYVKSSDGTSAINFYSLGEISAGGYSESGGGGTGGLFGIIVNGQTYTPVDGYITIPNYPTSLTWGNIANKPTTIAGYGITDAYTKTESDNQYVNVVGDTMTGALKINSASLDQLLVINSTQTPYMEFQLNGVRQAVFGGADGVASVYTNTWHKIWHAGNDGSGSGLDADTLDSYHYSDIINGNVASATKLQTKRIIWGQGFDGTADVNGDFKLIGDYMFFENASTTKGIYFASKEDGSFGFYGHNNFSYSKVFGVIDYNTRFWGIGTETPSYMMHINGTMYAADASLFGSSLNVLGLVSSDTGFSTTKYIQIGDGRIYWDSTNNALYVKHKDGSSAINFYSLGEISAGGYSDAGGGGSTSNILGIIVNGGTYTPSNGYITLPNYPTSLAWSSITGKPSTFTPSSHTHTKSQITDFPTTWAWGRITGKPTTLSGYGITDGVNKITTSGSGSVVSNITLSGHTLTVTKTNISGGGVTSVSTSGSGNAVTSASISGSTLTLTKGSSFLLKTGNAASATKLQTPRTIWGQSFDGSANVDGDIYINGDFRLNGTYMFFKNRSGTNGLYLYTISDGSLGLYKHSNFSYKGLIGYISYSSGYVGIGIENPSYKLHVNGSMYATSYANSSDIRLKNKRYDINISTSQIASAPTFVFSWINDGRIDIGTSAQYWKEVLPDIVKEDNNGYLMMPNANIALASVICLARNVETIEQRVSRLEKENTELKQKLIELAA